MTPTFFKTPADLRRWLMRHHATRAELLVGYHQRASDTPSITWPESVDQALCFGWIDGIRRRLDDARYTIRFTPRRRGSIWSVVNIRRVQALQGRGLMRPADRGGDIRQRKRVRGPDAGPLIVRMPVRRPVRA